MKQNEIDTFIRDVKDVETGFVYYEDYVAMMTAENPEDILIGKK